MKRDKRNNLVENMDHNKHCHLLSLMEKDWYLNSTTKDQSVILCVMFVEMPACLSNTVTFVLHVSKNALTLKVTSK